MTKDSAEYHITLTAVSPWRHHKGADVVKKAIETLFQKLNLDITDIEVLRTKVSQ